MSSLVDDCLRARKVGVALTEFLCDVERSKRFANPVAEELKCGICMDVMVTPVTVCGENHVFCETCITEWKSHGSCPQCRRPLREFTPLRLAQNLIHKSHVYCDHHSSGWWQPSIKKNKRRKTGSPPPPSGATGCEWVGELTNLPSHLKECGYVKVFCPHDGCPRSEEKPSAIPTILRRELKQHCETCLFRLYPCDYCHVLIAYNQKDDHLSNNCQEYEIKCENKCGVSMKRKDYTSHLCPQQIIPCEFAPYGCQVIMMRKEMETHYKESPHSHSIMTASKMSDFDSRINALIIENKKLMARIQLLEKDATGSRGISWEGGSNFCLEFTVDHWSEQKYGENIFSKPITRSARTWKLCVKRELIQGVEHLGVFLHLDAGPVPVTIQYKLKILHYRTREVVSTFFPDTARTFLSCKGWGFRGWSLMVCNKWVHSILLKII